ncbi:OLC1v1001670C1 [Oldenlandia corymbosa var. corymbosa]|uniref:OLC1v1001670C1 n=1 Tax=Oldenlandia corymbosa var. corymbosa TaxID=529605 RepID=A0AAV1D5Z2_OLDCO|nr:OLC1v1001670C1 [Oldenlandia corymbosa var. corymbosa]
MRNRGVIWLRIRISTIMMVAGLKVVSCNGCRWRVRRMKVENYNLDFLRDLDLKNGLGRNRGSIFRQERRIWIGLQSTVDMKVKIAFRTAIREAISDEITSVAVEGIGWISWVWD